MSEFPPPLPHGPIEEIFPDVFFVTGGFRFAPGLAITRNMTIVRQGKELVVLNSVRLTPAGEAELDKLGTVTHVVRVGAFHGADDPYFVDRYRAKLWAAPNTEHVGELQADEELRPGSCPLDGSSVFAFEHGKMPEVAIVLDREGGLLITCDSYQNWTTFEGCSFLGKIMMRLMGFGPTLVGGPWAKRMGPEVKDDLEKLAELPFRHLIPAHGTVLRETARDGLRTAINHRFS